MAFLIRPLSPDDHPQWKTLWADYNAFYGRSDDTALPASVVSETRSRLLDYNEPIFGFVAGSDDTLLGLAHVVLHRNLIQIADTCYLQDLFTTPDARGQGVARALIDTVASFCASRGIEDIYWHTQISNAAARRLYDTLATDTGFTVYRKPLA